MLEEAGFIWSNRYTEFNLGDSHPMNPRRLIVPYELFNCLGVLKATNIQLITPSPATDPEILLFHTQRYLDAMKELSDEEGGYQLNLGLGSGDCPVFPEMHESSRLIAGGALEGARRVQNGDVKHAFSLLGGLHHAFSERAAGFCYYNDAAITIKYLQKEYGIERILYIDTDVHAGDGVLDAFYDDESVLGISIHESPQFIFPGTGYSNELGEEGGTGYTINMPLYPGTWDDLYIRIFEEIIPCLWNSYDPEFVIWQCGADGHFKDVLGHLTLTTHLYQYLGKRMAELTENCSAKGKLLMLGGGGYNPDSVARVWLTSFAGVTGFELPKESPVGWLEYCQTEFGIRTSANIHDEPIDPKRIEQHVLIEEANNQYLQVLKEELRDTTVWTECSEIFKE
ncbi:MAG: acetoin utilization protein AcuC [Candidatus Hodarchaeales archaeon]